MKSIIPLMFILLLLPAVFADPLVFRTNQSEYYFLVNQDALIQFDVENLNSPISGQMSYTISQSISQQGFSYTNQRTDTQTATVTNPFILNLGTSSQPTTLDLSMTFDYNDNGQNMHIDFPHVRVYFVTEENQKQNTQNNQQSTSKTQQQIQEEQQKQQQEQQQELERQMRQQEAQNQIQNRIANNQLGQDTGAIKQEMEKQMHEQEQMKQDFQRNVASSQEVSQLHNELKQQGYDLKETNFNPVSNDTGSFDMTYENSKGEQATVKGSMQNNTITSLSKLTDDDKKKLLDVLAHDKRFQQMDNTLADNNYNKSDISFSQIDMNSTDIKLQYNNKLNETNSITASIVNDTVTEVVLEKAITGKQYNYMLWAMLMFVAILGYLGYSRLPKKKEIISETALQIEHFDYRKEALHMISQAKKLFTKKMEKDAYEKVGQAVRLYYSHDLGIKHELTNSELLRHLKNDKMHGKVKECLHLCSMVEFAKYKANSKDFNKITTIAQKIIT
jgi:hypothetical protein